MNVRDDFARFQRESRLARNGIYTTSQKRWNARGETVERSIASRDLHCSDGETALEDPWGGTHCGAAAYLRNLEGDTTSQLRQPHPAGRQPRTDPRRHGHRADLLDDGGPIPHRPKQLKIVHVGDRHGHRQQAEQVVLLHLLQLGETRAQRPELPTPRDDIAADHRW